MGVLASLDSAATTSFYWYLALLACVGGFLFGYDTADISRLVSSSQYKPLLLGTPSNPPAHVARKGSPSGQALGAVCWVQR